MKNFDTQNSKRPFSIFLLWLLALAWLAVCVILSSQTGEESGKLSTAIAEQIAVILQLPKTSVPAINSDLRTFAHFACFFVLGAFMSAAFAVTFPKKSLAFLWPLLPCVMFAFIDEVRKAYLPGRHCSFPEACLNAVSCVLGCAAIGLILRIMRRRKE